MRELVFRMPFWAISYASIFDLRSSFLMMRNSPNSPESRRKIIPIEKSTTSQNEHLLLDFFFSLLLVLMDAWLLSTECKEFFSGIFSWLLLVIGF